MRHFVSRRRKLYWAAAVLLVSVAGGLAGAQAFAQNTGDSITVGVVMPITGRESKPGQYQREGIELAIKQINDAGGIKVKGKQYKIKEVFYDDGSDSTKSQSLCERAMTTDGAIAVIGGYSTALGEAESGMADRHQTPWISPGAGASSIYSHAYKYAFGALSPISLLGG